MKNSFSIVTANYNNSIFLEEFVESVTADFKENRDLLEVIIVDDGSTDDSRHELMRLREKYPEQIKVFFNKENKGVAYSRNKGLTYATKEWVCFFDVDDFVSDLFFRNLDEWIENKDKNLALIFLKVIEYYENGSKKEHPLNYRFNDSNVESPVKIRNYQEITQSSTTSIFRRDLIRSSNLLFDERIKVFFEDGKFELEYMLNNPEKFCGYFANGHYCYRKKMGPSSLSFNSWACKERYSTDLQYALEILDTYKSTEYVKRKLFYELFWFVKYSINKPIRQYVDPKLIDELFAKFYSSVQPLLFNSYNKCGYWHFYKVGLLGRYKKTRPYHNFLYIDDVNSKTGVITARSYSFFKDEECVQILQKNGSKIEVKLKKRVENQLFENHFVYANIYEINLKRIANRKEDLKSIEIQFISNGKAANIDAGGVRQYKYKASDIIKNHTNKRYGNKTIVNKCKRFFYSLLARFLKLKDAWLFMDRDVWADDSAEVLFKWVSKNHREINAIFAVNKDTPEYIRLKRMGLKVVPFGGLRYKAILNTCQFFISSHIDNYQLKGLLKDKERSFLYAFLQHGVIKDDISGWLNRKQIDYFITSTRDEYKYIVEDGPFKFTNNEVHLIGLPRHDLLEDRSSKEKPQIIIMPTWRQSLSICKAGSDEKLFNPEFPKSEFAQTWKRFLHSEKLEELHDLGVKIIFCPHANLQIYLDWFDVPKWIVSFDINTGGSIRDIFKSSNLMITDSSSAAFEMAIMKKPVIYYQFDMEQMWLGSHIASRGYFSYETMGFGPVVKDQDSLQFELQKIIDSSFKLPSLYDERFKIFCQHKKSRCELIFADLLKLKKNSKKLW